MDERGELTSLIVNILSSVCHLIKYETVAHLQYLVNTIKASSDDYKNLSLYDIHETLISLLQLNLNVPEGKVIEFKGGFSLNNEIETLSAMMIARIDELDES